MHYDLNDSSDSPPGMQFVAAPEPPYPDSPYTTSAPTPPPTHPVVDKTESSSVILGITSRFLDRLWLVPDIVAPASGAIGLRRTTATGVSYTDVVTKDFATTGLITGTVILDSWSDLPLAVSQAGTR